MVVVARRVNEVIVLDESEDEDNEEQKGTKRYYQK